MRKKFRTIGVGGTFDELHKGHRSLLMKAFEVGEHVIIGISSDVFVESLGKPHATANYEQRLKELRSFLNEKGLLKRAQTIPIDDAFGGVLLSESSIEALVVSRETESTARRINETRKKDGKPQLEILVIDLVPSENHLAISTTRIRKGEIDREGHLIKRKS
jgi:pantetheine-phosphate adenylyltransferase